MRTPSVLWIPFLAGLLPGSVHAHHGWQEFDEKTEVTVTKAGSRSGRANSQIQVCCPAGDGTPPTWRRETSSRSPVIPQKKMAF